MMVTYAKGVRRPAEIDAEWPWQVEIAVPWNGLGKRLAEITAWVRDHAPPPESAKGGAAGLDATRWCFRDWETAAAFQADFGGDLVEAKPARGRRSWPV